MTRARDQLHVVHPLRFYVRQQRRYGDSHVYAPRTRFIPDAILDKFTRVSHGLIAPADSPTSDGAPRVDIGARLRAIWS
jgi:DNA helicase-2/ATP-dependent DNA helicase PcrA